MKPGRFIAALAALTIAVTVLAAAPAPLTRRASGDKKEPAWPIGKWLSENRTTIEAEFLPHGVYKERYGESDYEGNWILMTSGRWNSLNGMFHTGDQSVYVRCALVRDASMEWAFHYYGHPEKSNRDCLRAYHYGWTIYKVTGGAR